MIITKTPYRISLFGGGTDHPAWYKKHGGEVISFAIDKYCYLATRVIPPYFDFKYRILYSKNETTSNVDDISHPAVREAIRKFCPNLPLEIHHGGDLPARTGIGSSSAFTVGLINSLLILQNKVITSHQLANEAIELEQVDLMENVGSQDQIASALGGMNYIKFDNNLDWQATPITTTFKFQESITNRIVLIYTGIQRISSDIQANLLVNLDKKNSTMQRTIELARECRKIFEEQGDLDLIGEMLVESWSLKKEMNSKAITSALSAVWEKSMSAGALGGKVLGAGGGGFCMFWVKEDGREEFLKNFNLGTYVPVQISNTGSECILNSSL
jgi:D-glycero-alpha-D-manno-heptose-7-phosphate kinase